MMGITKMSKIVYCIECGKIIFIDKEIQTNEVGFNICALCESKQKRKRKSK